MSSLSPQIALLVVMVAVVAVTGLILWVIKHLR